MRVCVSADWPVLDEILDWCSSNRVDLYYGRIWADAGSPVGWSAVLEWTPRIDFLLIKYSDRLSVLEI